MSKNQAYPKAVAMYEAVIAENVRKDALLRECLAVIESTTNDADLIARIKAEIKEE